MLFCDRVKDSLRETHVNHMDYVGLGTKTHQEVVWLDISMDETFVVHVVKPFEQLNTDHKGCLETESVATEFEQISE